MNTNIYSYLETSGGQSSNLYLKCCSFFSTTVLIRQLWQLKTVVFLFYLKNLTLLSFGDASNSNINRLQLPMTNTMACQEFVIEFKEKRKN